MDESKLRVLQVLDDSAAAGTEKLIADLSVPGGAIEHDLLRLGSSSAPPAARGHDAFRSGHIPLSRRTPRSLTRVLRSWIAAQAASGRRHHVVQTWGVNAGEALVGAFSGPILLTITRSPGSDRDEAKLRRLLQVDQVEGLSLSHASVATLHPEHAITVILPGMAPSGPLDSEGGGREHWRRRWGVDESLFVVGLFGAAPTLYESRDAVAGVHRLRLTGRDIRLVLPERIEKRADVDRFARRMNCRGTMIFDDALSSPWTCAAGLDAAVQFRGGLANASAFHAFPALWAMAAGVPVLVQECAAIREYLPEGPDEILIPEDDRQGAWNRLMHLHDDAGFRRRLADTLASRIRERFGLDRFRAELNDLYRRRAAGAVRHASFRADHAPHRDTAT